MKTKDKIRYLTQKEKFILNLIGPDRLSAIFRKYETYENYINQYNVDSVNGYDWEYKNLKHKLGGITKEDIFVDDKNNIKLKDNKILYYIDWIDQEDFKFHFNRRVEKSIFHPVLYSDLLKDEIDENIINFRAVKLKYILHNPYKRYNNYLFCHSPKMYSSVTCVDDVIRLYDLDLFDERIVSMHNGKYRSRVHNEYIDINGDFKEVKVKSYQMYSYGYSNDLSYSWCANLNRYKEGWNKKKYNKLNKQTI